MIEPEQLAPAFEPNMGKAPVVGKSWDSFAGRFERLRVVPWYRVMAATTKDVPVFYSSSAIAGLGGMITAAPQPSEIPTDGEIGTPLVKTATGVGFERLRLLE